MTGGAGGTSGVSGGAGSGGAGSGGGASGADGGMPIGGESGAGSLVPIASMNAAYFAVADDGGLALWNSTHVLPAEAEALRFTAVAIGGQSFDNVLCGITREGPTRSWAEPVP